MDKWLSSGAKTADAVIHAGKARLGGVMVNTDGVNDVTVSLYDNASAASGTKLAPAFTLPGAERFGGYINLDVVAHTGIYLDITTAGTTEVVVYYRKD